MAKIKYTIVDKNTIALAESGNKGDIIDLNEKAELDTSSVVQNFDRELRNLAKENLNWTYEFGPELYLDMKNIDCKARIDNNREWISLGLAYKKNILFDTNGMYNDMLNDNRTSYWCIRNKVKKMKKNFLLVLIVIFNANIIKISLETLF